MRLCNASRLGVFRGAVRLGDRHEINLSYSVVPLALGALSWRHGVSLRGDLVRIRPGHKGFALSARGDVPCRLESSGAIPPRGRLMGARRRWYHGWRGYIVHFGRRRWFQPDGQVDTVVAGLAGESLFLATQFG